MNFTEGFLEDEPSCPEVQEYIPSPW